MPETEPKNFLLLRGLARESRHWGSFPEVLKEHFPKSKIELIDVAGNGTEVNKDSFTEISAYVLDLRRRSQLIQDHQKPIIVAVSLGAMIASLWAHSFPDELSGLVLINTSDGGSSPVYERLRPRALKKLIEIVGARDNRLLSEIKALEMTSNRKENYQAWAEQFSQFPRTSVPNFSKQIFAASRYRFSKEKPKIPTLLMTSLGDNMVSHLCTEKIAKLWQLPALVHETAGHDLSLDEPLWVNQQIKAWLNLPSNS